MLADLVKKRENDLGRVINQNATLWEYIEKLTYKRQSEWKPDTQYNNVIRRWAGGSVKNVNDMRENLCFWDAAKGQNNSSLYPPQDGKVWYFHAVPFVACLQTIVSDRVENLKRVQDFVLSLPCLGQGKSGMYSTTLHSRTTYCNHAVFLTIEATDGRYMQFTNGRSDPPWWNLETAYNYTNSNYWCDILGSQSDQEHSASTGIVEVSAANAQLLANLGYTVIGAWKNLLPEDGDRKSPHYVTVAPNIREYNVENGPWVAHVGASPNGYKDAARAFWDKPSREIRWYYNSRQEFRFYFGQLYLLNLKKE
jgi:hypothetical protein